MDLPQFIHSTILYIWAISVWGHYEGCRFQMKAPMLVVMSFERENAVLCWVIMPFKAVSVTCGYTTAALKHNS